MKPLYELTDEYQTLLNNFYDQETGEVNLDIEEKLKEIDHSIEQKCINIGKAIQNIDSEIKAVREALRNMTERLSKLIKKEEYLKSYVLNNMEKSNKKEIKCEYFVIKSKLNPPSVSILDENLIPELYRKYSFKYDLSKIKIDLSIGNHVPGAVILQRKSLSIK